MRIEKIEVDFTNKILQVIYNQKIENDEKVQLKNYDNDEDMVRELCILLRKEMNRDYLFN